MYPDSDNVPMMVGEPQNVSYGKKRILFVDPDKASYLLVSQLLAEYGVEIIHSGCGLNAIRIFREDPSIDGIITELILPGLDGFGILREARKIRPGVPVIAQTTCVFNDVEQRCRKAGFDEYISKPIDLGLFVGMVKKHVLHSGH